MNMNDIEQVREALTPTEMRAEIFRLARYDSMVRAVTDTADYNGLSAEDRYTMLAYHALSGRAIAMKQIHDYIVTTPFPFATPAPVSVDQDAPALNKQAGNQTDGGESDLAELRVIAAKAAPGPFEYDEEHLTVIGSAHCPSCGDHCAHVHVELDPEDLDFLIASANYVTKMLAPLPADAQMGKARTADHPEKPR